MSAAELEAYLDRLALQFFRGREVSKFCERVKNGIPNTVPPRTYWPRMARTLAVLDALRRSLGAPIIITSAWRAPGYNLVSGGVPGSQHTEFTALDFHCVKGAPIQWAARLKTMRGKAFIPGDGPSFVFRGGVGIYPARGFVHVDTRGWDANFSG